MGVYSSGDMEKTTILDLRELYNGQCVHSHKREFARKITDNDNVLPSSELMDESAQAIVTSHCAKEINPTMKSYKTGWKLNDQHQIS